MQNVTFCWLNFAHNKNSVVFTTKTQYYLQQKLNIIYNKNSILFTIKTQYYSQ